MTLWRRTRGEAAGAWRSMRYDLGRREPDAEGASPVRAGEARCQDVTSTGMSTFGGGLRTSYGDEIVPRPRRLVAVSAFGVLAVAGAAGGYFAVVNGIGAPIGDEPAGVEPYPLAAQAPRGSDGELSNSGLGRGAAAVPGGPAPAVTRTGPETVPVLTTTAAAPVTTRPRPSVPAGTTPATPPATCDCQSPPVPTPTAPAPTPHSPSATPSPSASSSGSESPIPSEPAQPASPSASGDGAGTGEDATGARRAPQH